MYSRFFLKFRLAIVQLTDLVAPMTRRQTFACGKGEPIGPGVIKTLALACLAGWLWVGGPVAFASENINSNGGTNTPVLLYISRTDCHFCHLFENEILNPLIRSGKYRDTLVIRNVVLDSPDSVMNFEGDLVPPEELAQRFAVELTPTLLFLDSDGVELAPRVVGYQRSEFYFYYFEKALDHIIKLSNSPEFK